MLNSLASLVTDSGFAGILAAGGYKNLIMIVVACVLLYLGIKKQYEPLLMVGIAVGCLLSNISYFEGLSPELNASNALYHPELWADFLNEASPYAHTCFVSNLGSIKMDAQYHHLANFGSNSFFAIIGRKDKKPVFKDDGTFEMKEFLPISFTIDERIGDGVYFANTIKIFKAYMMRPELLDLPANQSVDIRPVEEELGL